MPLMTASRSLFLSHSIENDQQLLQYDHGNQIIVCVNVKTNARVRVYPRNGAKMETISYQTDRIKWNVNWPLLYEL